MTLSISATIYRQLLEQADVARPLEIVGMLLGRGRVIDQCLPLENIAVFPEKEFMADPEGLLYAIKHIRTQQLELIALYHSHPNGPANPSRTDFLEAKWDVPMLILDPENQVIRAWQLETGLEVALNLV